MESMRASAWMKIPRVQGNQPGDGGGQVVRSREDGMARMGRSAREGVCLLRVPVCWILGLSGGDRLPQV